MVRRMAILVSAFTAAVILSGTPVDALKLYRDTQTGAIFSTPGETREEYKPFGLDIGFQFWLQYDVELENRNQPAGTAYALKNTNTAPYDAFSATRSIVDIRRAFTRTFRTRLVLDTRGSAVGAYNVYVRHVYGEFDAPSLASTFAVGEIPLPITPYDDAFWGYRVQGGGLMEREGLAMTGDWGIGWTYKPAEVPIEWTSVLSNGEGRTTAEFNSGKSFESRLTWKTPLDGLNLSVAGLYATGGNLATPAAGAVNTGVHVKQTRYELSAFYKRPTWRIGAIYTGAEDEADNYANAALLLSNAAANMNRQSNPTTGYAINSIKSHGWSVMGVGQVPNTPWSVIGRVDWFDPGQIYADNAHTRLILGPAYKANEWMTVLLTWEDLNFQTGAEQASGNLTANAFDQSRLLLQAEIKF